MGTNYYIERPRKSPCPHCLACGGVERIHIGKQSFGWVFSLRGYTEDGLPSSEGEWLELLRSGVRVVDEYDRETPAEDVIGLILRGQGQRHRQGDGLSHLILKQMRAEHCDILFSDFS